MAEQPRNLVSTVAERYELVERIAVGGMAEVFRAKKYGSHGFAKQMAVKRILPSLAANDEFVTRFIAEAKIAVTLSHANIVQVFDFSRFADSLYIAMEFVDGADLAEVLKRCRKKATQISVAPALHVAMELLKGLDFAHSKRVIHRDISPSNILLSRAGEVKVADFGIAQAAGLDVTRKQRVMGKWPYMSPEQTRGDDLTVKSDLFSAGTVLYELLTGHRLFRGANAEEIAEAIASREIPPPSSLRSQLPTGLDEPLLSLLERDPKKRPAAADVLAALVEVSYESTVQATAASLAGELESLLPDRSETGRDDSSANLIDDIINSELAHSDGSGAENTRVTMASTSVGAEVAEVGDSTGMTFIKTSHGAEGISEWVVGDSTGIFSFKRTDRLYALSGDEDPEVPTDLPSRAKGFADPMPTLIDATSGMSGTTAESNAALGARYPRRDAFAEDDDDRRPRFAMFAAVGVAAVALAIIGFVVASGGSTDPGADARASAFAGEISDAGTKQAPANITETASTTNSANSAKDRPAVNSSLDGGSTQAAGSAGDEAVVKLSITSEPVGAEVWRDNLLVGTTPMTVPALTTAESIRFSSEGFSDCERTASPSTAEVSCTLEASSATLSVNSTPRGADVFLGKKRLGKTPITNRLVDAYEGRVRVTLRKKGFRSVSESITLAASTETRVNKRLEPDGEKGLVDIFSEPWANVYLAGKKIGVAPARGLSLPAGTHRLTLVNPVQNRRTTLTVKIPGKRRYKVTLPEAR